MMADKYPHWMHSATLKSGGYRKFVKAEILDSVKSLFYKTIEIIVFAISIPGK